MAGRLTTHVLDTVRGVPAAGVGIALFAIEGEGRRLLARLRTNANGRTDTPLLEGAAMQIGPYELVFAVAAYFSATGAAMSDPPFLTDVPLRFTVADAAAHYHVPLLVSPWAYSTYRGS
jgi:5-hydroxyisourate hydrolase